MRQIPESWQASVSMATTYRPAMSRGWAQTAVAGDRSKRCAVFLPPPCGRFGLGQKSRKPLPLPSARAIRIRGREPEHHRGQTEA